MELKGVGVVLTGASGGIGQALVRELVSQGAHVLAVARRVEPLQALLTDLGERRSQVRVVQADVSKTEGMWTIVQACRQSALPVRVLVHAAAIGGFGGFENTEPAHIAASLQTDLLAPLLLTQVLLPLLKAQPQAQVVAVGSALGHIGYPGQVSYCAAKFGLRGAFEALSREYADSTVRFQWLAPRATRTTFNSNAVDAMNAELKTAVDSPEAVAAQLLAAIRDARPRLQIGWPEKLFVRLNGAFPALVDRALRRDLPVIRRYFSTAAEAVVPLQHAQGDSP